MKLLKIFTVSILLNTNFYAQNSVEFKNLIDFQKKLIDEKITASNELIIYKGNKIVYKNAQNSFKNGDKEITSETLFPIWSMSKVVTTIGILQLIEKGLVNLNDPVSKYIPSFASLNCMFLDPKDPKIEFLQIFCLITNLKLVCSKRLLILFVFRCYLLKADAKHLSTISYYSFVIM